MEREVVSETRNDGSAARSRRYAFGLLIYAVATVTLFVVISRNLDRIRPLYGYDIENTAVQYCLYGLIFVAATIVGDAALTRLRLPRLGSLRPLRRRESQLRLIFLGAAALALAVAVFQSRYGAAKFVSYFGVGTLAAFATCLWLTKRRWGFVELVAAPTPGEVDAVLWAHSGVALADLPWDRAKRAVDAVVALSIIIVSLPISLPLVIVLWLQDPGPILVAKVAVKRGGQSFNQLKLRTMIKDAEHDTGPVPAAPDDARVTPLGGLLRRTHIDELPQMFNMLVGDMSLVGPRPERTVFVARHIQRIPGYAERHAVRPGLAGLAQVFGDYYSTPSEKLRYDRLYIRRRGPLLDLKLFGAALLLAFLGIAPSARRRRRTEGLYRRQERRFQRAYSALRGGHEGDAPDRNDEDAH